ncbi:unnamed protein product [Sphagnum balticum]
MSFITSWCSARCGGLSLIILFGICFYALWDNIPQKYGKQRHTGGDPSSPSTCYYIFAYYSLIVHGCVVIFQLRACWAILQTTAKLSKVANQSSLATTILYRNWKLSWDSLSNSETSDSASSFSSFDRWENETESEDDSELVTHAILIANYKENIEVYLAMEVREANAASKASQLMSKFKNRFRLITATFHPDRLPGESPGKSSNLSWAARIASGEYKLASRKDVILTSIDADSHLSWRYFSEITSMHLSAPDTSSATLYAAPIIFDRNAHRVAAVVRVADVAWCAAGMSGQYGGSIICPPTSAYSIPLELADRVGGWDVGPEAIGEDLHMYLKCFFALNGDLLVRPVTCPVSQTNITGVGDARLQGVRARYRQALRHMWGSLDSGYALGQIAKLWRRRNVTREVVWPLHFTEKDKEQNRENGSVVPVKSPNWLNIFFLFHRLFEAHFMPAHISILVLTTLLCRYLSSFTTIANSNPLTLIFSATDTLSLIGFLSTLFYFFTYQTYHALSLQIRKCEMVNVGLADEMEKGDGFSARSWINVLDCVWIPFVAPLYGSLPAIQAQLGHFWSRELVYVVSNKPVRGQGRVE